MSHAGHASASVRLVNERMLLTASGRVRNLTTDRLAVVDHDGKPLDGQLEPAVAEIVPMHAAVYRARPNVGGVIHTHSPAVTAFALAHRPLPCRYEALLRFGQATAAPVVPWAPQVCPCHRLPGHSQVAIRGTAPAFWVERHLRPTRWRGAEQPGCAWPAMPVGMASADGSCTGLPGQVGSGGRQDGKRQRPDYRDCLPVCRLRSDTPWVV
ncbi:class II aldolase/adducin family protein [Mycobacterium kansasii]|uniref:class II aldolase/adducin family protein n=1 Tax=Mycobacterium kansasii TaxID=1768 RepID=UPI000CDE22C5|nr:hypothetical protein C3B43_27590 [Mycobacterium kansasii]POY12604.1 hypothetical protein C3476_27780 [Mycobacterium kansasii]